MYRRSRPERASSLVMKAQESDMAEKPSLDILTIEEAADLIRVSRRHFQKLLAEGDGPPLSNSDAAGSFG
jgi:hypothetical protein